MPSKSTLVTAAWTIAILAGLMRVDQVKKAVLNEGGLFG